MRYTDLIKSHNYGTQHYWCATLKEAKENIAWNNYTCGSGLVGNGFFSAPKNTRHSWTYLVFNTTEGSLSYREPFWKEIIKRFNDSGVLKVWYYRGEKDLYGRIIIRIYSETPTEWVFMFLSMCRHGWEHLKVWPLQNKPPTPKEVFIKFLIDRRCLSAYSSRIRPYQIEHAIWCYLDQDGRDLKITPEIYVNEVFRCIEEKDLPHSSKMIEADDFGMHLGKPLYKIIKGRLAERIEGKKEKKYDPFA